ncbi:MAG: undecaprenyl/decaprenyl-phosphate alpha-N-acetylglucosaminyl 1-phosphate transferase [Planctomycetes bacterium]|nr:undecaprenyl/decaprenyl-phosphate alpha-N-acetylglucosaminyl 1-phosphate transferase [Planctomycetota bacterium]
MLHLLGLSIFGVSLFLAWTLTSVMEGLAPRLGLIDQPSGRRVHLRPTPKCGGLAIFVATAAPVLAGYLWILFAREHPRYLPASVAAEMPRMLEHARTLLILFAGAAAFVALGLADDLRGLSVSLRLGVEFLVAAALFFLTDEVRVTLFSPYPWTWLGFTLLWVVGITNSFNLLDNMDGLSAGVAFIISAMLLAVGVITQQYLVAALTLAFMGALGGFLILNFPPASIFMGDSGSLFIGYFVAVLTTVCTFTSFQEGNFVAATVPVLFLAVPLYDTASVVWIRWRSGRSIFSADKNHLSHRLVGLGFSHRDAVLVIYLLTFLCGVPATLVGQLNLAGTILVLAQVSGILLLTAILERAGRRAMRAQNSGARPLGEATEQRTEAGS